MPGGRPSALDKIVTTRLTPDGVINITAGDRIIELMRIGATVERAARSVDINKGTLYAWIKNAATARSLLVVNPDHKLTPHQQACLEFSDSVDRAESEYEMASLGLIERLANGVVRETVTERWEHELDRLTGLPLYDTDNRPVMRLAHRTVQRSTAEPDLRAITWKLERRFRDRYVINPADNAAATTPEGVDLTPTTVDEMVNDVEAFLAETDR